MQSLNKQNLVDKEATEVHCAAALALAHVRGSHPTDIRAQPHVVHNGLLQTAQAGKVRSTAVLSQKETKAFLAANTEVLEAFEAVAATKECKVELGW